MGSQLIRTNSRTGQTKIKKISSAPTDLRRKKLHPPPTIGFIHSVSNGTQSPSRKRLTVIYSGQVQGVGFRYTVKTVAMGFEVTGVVRNLLDKRVELMAEGQPAELEAFRSAIRDAGLAGFIRDEQVHWADATFEFRGFEIVR
jgi:acylphosphatase